MKTLIALCAAALTATAAFAADATPSFNATLTVGKESRFVLLGADGKASSWLKVGDSFEGYTIKGFDAKSGALDLEKDGKVSHVALAADAKVQEGASTGVTPATVADATAVLDKMHFERMLDRTLAGVKKQQAAMVDKMMGQLARPGVEREDLVAFQRKVLDTMMSGMSAAEMKDDVAKAYSQIFTKEELDGLASFYASPIGEAFSDKQPQLAEKMNEILVPRMMANMPKVQQLAQEFAAQQQAKKAAAAATAQPAATPAPTPAPAAAPAPAPKP